MEKMMRDCPPVRRGSPPSARCATILRLVGRLSRQCLLLSALSVLAAPASVWAEVTNPHGLAVIIGNRSYTGDVPPVDYAHRDAQAFQRYVVDVLGFDPANVIHIEDATRRQMFDVFGSPRAMMSDIQARLNILAPQDGSDVVVYYSGHGVPGKEGGASILPANIAPYEAETESYPLALLYEKLGALRYTKTVRVFVEACFSGSSDGGRLEGVSPVYQEPAFPEEVTDKMVILTAVTGKQLATWDNEAGHGLFTHHLLDALYGKGDTDGDGEVTAREAKAYLDRYMTSNAWIRNRRHQDAVLTTRSLSGLALASAAAGGEFPQRPGLRDEVTGTGTGTTVADDADETQALAEAKVTKAPAPEEAPLTLTRADRRLVQGGLLVAGLDVGVVDGLFGPRTEAAIRGYQKKKGWPETGELTRAQAEALMALGREWQAGTAPQATPGVPKTPPKSDPSAIVLAGGLRLSDWALLAEDRLGKGEYRTLLVEGMAHIRAHGAHRSVESIVERALEGLVKGLRVTDEASARAALQTVNQIRGVAGQSAELVAIEAKAHRRLGQLPQAVAAYRTWLRLAPAGHPERKRMLLALQRAERGEVGLEVFRDCDGTWCPEMVVVPAGSFMMGSPSGEAGRYSNEGPMHEVTIEKPFAVGVFEVKFEEWEACRRGGGCSHNPDDKGWGRGRHPVINVSWKDAQAYVRWLSREAGAEYRLPSESEWEYVARAGTTGPFHFGSTISTEQANYDGNYTYGSGRKGRYRERTVPVGGFPPNAFGLHDVHGNVWEWVEDCWHGNYRGAPSDGSAWTSGGDCSRRVLRGGSWIFEPQFLRSAYRGRYTSGARNVYLGFRVARTLN